MGYRISDMVNETLNEMVVIDDIKECLKENTDVNLSLTISSNFNEFEITFYNDELDIYIFFNINDLKINDDMYIDIFEDIFTDYPVNNAYSQSKELISLLNDKGLEIYNNWKKEMK